jgi:hypothetical protein
MSVGMSTISSRGIKMDEKLLTRIQAVAVVLVCLAYFLPWASVMTPLGSIEMRGLYVDYAWVLLLLAVVHLLVQFARLNMSALGISTNAVATLDRLWKGLPFAFLAFFAWYASTFFLRDSNLSAPAFSPFGISVASLARAGLDYGFWLGALGAVVAVAMVGLLSMEFRKFATIGTITVILAVGTAFAIVKAGSSIATSSGPATAAAETGVPAPSPPPTEVLFDATPYVTISKISGTVLLKDINASRFSDMIIVSPVFKNIGSKTIVGLQGRISMLDGFGKEVYGFNFRADNKLAVGEESTGGYQFEGNQFEDDDPYHKMLPLLTGGTAKYSSQVTRIAFADGTVLPKP